MQDTPVSPPANHQAVKRSPSNQPVLPQAPTLGAEMTPGHWLAIGLVSFYFLYLWAPPQLPIPAFRWYFVSGLAIVAYLLQRRPLNASGAKVFWIPYGLMFLGAVLSLLRAWPLNPEGALKSTVGMGISFVSYMLFVPVLSTRLARRTLLIVLIGVMILWTAEIQRLLAEHGFLIYSTFAETGGNKNYIGFGLSLTSTALFYLSVAWRPSKALRKWQLFIVRWVFALGGIYLFYNQTLIYARSSILTTFVGISAVLVVMFVRTSSKRTALLRVGVTATIVVLFIGLLLPVVFVASPQWQRISGEMLREDSTSFTVRETLLRKGLFLVGENPVLGVGAGGSKASVSSIYGSFPGDLIHNSYLADWAEMGILGLMGDVVWILLYLKILRTKFIDSPIFDQIWLLLFVPLFFEMNFINMNSISMMFYVILSGIYYEHYLVAQTQAAPESQSRVWGQSAR